MGCCAQPLQNSVPLFPPDLPRELSKVVLPVYTVEPPNILEVEAIDIILEVEAIDIILVVEAIDIILVVEAIDIILVVEAIDIILVVEAIDIILVVEAIDIVPKSPYLLRTGDMVAINVQGTLPDSPISGAFPIQPGGIVNLEAPYGTVKVTKMTTEDAQTAIVTA